MKIAFKKKIIKTLSTTHSKTLDKKMTPQVAGGVEGNGPTVTELTCYDDCFVKVTL
ncbi:hypothetical protein [Pseudoalteromonas sp. BMB]|uniref:hypothetical protein n=1 Tax=Pseudoalteromonas sp. BMB TaxID=1874619 RepID=UPI001586CECE|nr:hypothetical protein [Pseudoalteromonas sp. BMB]